MHRPPPLPPSLSPQVAAQTAYGIEAEVEGYEGAYSPDLITFMDFRRHHSGVWEDAAQNLTVSYSHAKIGHDYRTFFSSL